MKIEIEHAELLDIVNLLRARAETFARLPAEGLAPNDLQRALADKLLAQAGAAMKWVKNDVNASLIAAAPDLMAALERILEHGDRRNPDAARGDDAEVVSLALATIKKARARGAMTEGRVARPTGGCRFGARPSRAPSIARPLFTWSG